VHELLGLRSEFWKLLSILRATDVNLSEVRTQRYKTRKATHHWGIEFVQISPALSLWLHDIDLFIHEWLFVPNCRQSLFCIGAQRAVLSSEKRDSACVLKEAGCGMHFIGFHENNTEIRSLCKAIFQRKRERVPASRTLPKM
jgi:hypothetical protein